MTRCRRSWPRVDRYCVALLAASGFALARRLARLDRRNPAALRAALGLALPTDELVAELGN